MELLLIIIILILIVLSIKNKKLQTVVLEEDTNDTSDITISLNFDESAIPSGGIPGYSLWIDGVGTTAYVVRDPTEKNQVIYKEQYYPKIASTQQIKVPSGGGVFIITNSHTNYKESFDMSLKVWIGNTYYYDYETLKKFSNGQTPKFISCAADRKFSAYNDPIIPVPRYDKSCLSKDKDTSGIDVLSNCIYGIDTVFNKKVNPNLHAIEVNIRFIGLGANIPQVADTDSYDMFITSSVTVRVIQEMGLQVIGWKQGDTNQNDLIDTQYNVNPYGSNSSAYQKYYVPQGGGILITTCGWIENTGTGVSWYPAWGLNTVQYPSSNYYSYDYFKGVTTKNFIYTSRLYSKNINEVGIRSIGMLNSVSS